jgi:hypothetical protein
VTAWATAPGSGRAALQQTRGRITAVSADGLSAEFVDQLGQTRTARADLRPKATGAPAVGELWTIGRSGDAFVLGQLIGHPGTPEVTGPLDPDSALGGVVAGLVALGLVLDSTTAPTAPVRTPLALGAGWAAYATPAYGLTPPAPSWSLSGGVVRLHGVVTTATGVANEAPLATLPAAARPSTVRLGVMLSDLTTSAPAHVRADLTPAGVLLTPFAVPAGRILSLEPASWPTW